MNKRIAALPLIIIIGLGILGFAYAMWKDQAVIKGTVEMGSLNMAFDYVEPPMCAEFYKDPATGELIPGEYEDKDVGQQSCWYEDYVKDTHSGEEGFKTLTIDVTNAYPSYRVHVTFIVHNIGTVVGYLTEYNFEDYGSDEPLTWNSALMAFVNEAGQPVIDIEVTNTLPIQIDPCHSNKMEIDMHFKQPLLEWYTYKFKVTINCVNELE